MTLAAAPVLAAAIAAYWFFLKGDLQSRERVARWLYAGGRGRYYALWCARAVTLFGAVSVVGLLAMGRAQALFAMPAEFLAAQRVVVAWIGDLHGISIWLILAGLLIGGVIGGVIDRLRRGRRPWMLGDISAVMPRSPRELPWGAALSVVAGVTEELFFRLLVPLAIALLTGEAWIGFVVGILLFAGAHRYQGWLGVAATALVGALMTALYLMSGALWMAMVVHAAIDLNGLVLRPVMAGILSSSAASRS